MSYLKATFSQLKTSMLLSLLFFPLVIPGAFTPLAKAAPEIEEVYAYQSQANRSDMIVIVIGTGIDKSLQVEMDLCEYFRQIEIISDYAVVSCPLKMGTRGSFSGQVKDSAGKNLKSFTIDYIPPTEFHIDSPGYNSPDVRKIIGKQPRIFSSTASSGSQESSAKGIQKIWYYGIDLDKTLKVDAGKYPELRTACVQEVNVV